MGRELGRVGARPLPRRQPVGAAGPEICVSVPAGRGQRPDVSPDRAARHLGPAGAPALHQRLRHQAHHLRRRLRRPATRRPRPGQRHEPAGHLRRQGERHGRAGQHGLERSRRAYFRARPGGGRARRTQARRQLPCRGRERPDDLARQGAGNVLRHRARRRLERQGRGRGCVSLQHGVVVLPRRRRDDGAVGQLRHRGVRRFHHRRHGIDHERRRPLAGRAVAPTAGRPRQPHRGGQCRHRRQPDRGPGGIRPAEAVPGRTIGEATHRARRARAFRRHRHDLARRHQRLQQERQRAAGEGAERHEGCGRPHPRAPAGHARDRRHGRHRARLVERRARLPGAGREAQGAERIHPHVGTVRRRDRLRQGDARSADRRPQGRSSCRRARPAVPATSCTRTAPAISRWAWRSTSGLFAPKQ